VVERRRRRLLWPTVLLLLVGLGASLYLGNLHLEVHGPDGESVQSFCAINDDFNCVTVATSEYSSFLGLPVALYGIEFFLLALLAVLLSGRRAWRVKSWDSLIFDATLLALPVCGFLAYLSVTCIESICIMCMLVYGVMLLTCFLLGVSNRSRLGTLLVEGPRELLKSLRHAGSGAGLLVIALLAVSQFFWVPRLLHASTRPRPAHHEGDPVWKSLQFSGATLGPKDAPVVIEEFTDFECPHCGKAHRVMIRLLRQFPGKIHLIHRDYPLDNACNPILSGPFHRSACRAAFYARCAAQQDRYWPFEKLVFDNQDRLGRSDLERYARQAGLDPVRLGACVRNPHTRQAVVADIRRGVSKKMEGTPTFFINGEMVVGSRPLSFWVEKVSEHLQRRR
jgi:protein-disulfide isomerase